MTYTLEQFAADCHAILKNDDGPDALAEVRECLQRALGDESFLATHLGAHATKERDILYEDPELGFCICAHVYDGAKQGKPHDHGPTWAIYGQATGETEMTDWRILSPARDGVPAKVEKVRSYRLTPGDAHVYQIGDVHAPYRDAPTKLIRIEGRNTDTVERTPIEAA